MPTSIRTLLLGTLLALAACEGGPTLTAGTAGAPTATVGIPAGTHAVAPEGATERASVIRVVDGDTIIIDRGRGNERLRYIGVDAPESVKPDTPVEFMGKEAWAANARLVEGRTVLLEKDVSDTDRFGRLLRYVWVEDPGRPGGQVLVNLELVASGVAQAVTFPPDVRHADDFIEAERAAREQGLGLWGEAAPVP